MFKFQYILLVQLQSFNIVKFWHAMFVNVNVHVHVRDQRLFVVV